MPEPDSPAPGVPDDEAADAAWLVGNDEPASTPAAQTPPVTLSQQGDLYDLAPPIVEENVRPVEPIRDTRPPREKVAFTSESRPKPSLEPSEAVEQVWSRSAEWGPNIVILGAAGFALCFVLYVLVANEFLGLAVLLLIAGGVGCALLSYPILITLERPVRITPEQAVKDYFGALSHHVPHYRRMWLLLATSGRTAGSFASYEGFTNYWKTRLAQLRGDRVSNLTPLRFQVLDFKADKSAGEVVVSARFRIEVSARGRVSDGPIASYPIEVDLFRGPDRMWYLGKGTLPNA